MTLLAYSLRRTWGALLVLLVVVWLTMLAVGRIPVDIRHPSRNVDLSLWEQWRTQPQTWAPAALQVAAAVGVVCGCVTVWKLRAKMPFYVLVATGTVLLAFGIASFGVALANHDYRRIGWFDSRCERWCVPTAIQEHWERQLNRGINPVPWGIAGGVSTAFGLTLAGGAVATRRSRASREG